MLALVVGIVISTFVGCTSLLVWLFLRLPSVEKNTIAFFHPFADGGGGGERVLWRAISAVQDELPTFQVKIYVKEGVDAMALVKDAEARFNVVITKHIQVVPLARYRLIQPDLYPTFTLLRQAVGSVQLGWEALSKLAPEIYIDTTGWAFTYPMFRIKGCKVACYTHYPTISTDMLLRVWTRAELYNNNPDISGSPVKSVIKSAYYRLMALVYGLSGAFCNVAMVNSSWTQAHIQALWWRRSAPVLVYPPCDTEELAVLPLDRRLKQLFMVSVAQFRPEKNHRLQLEAFAVAKKRAGDDVAGHAVRVSRLKLVGSCRNPDDERRLAALQQHANDLGIAEYCDWCINVSFVELKQLLGGAVAGLHSMLDEHFGISIVEYMAAGVIPIAHNSGGPRQDIVTEGGPEGSEQRTGYLASTVDEYAAAITEVLAMDQRQRLNIAAAAQKRAARFSSGNFKEGFLKALMPLLHS